MSPAHWSMLSRLLMSLYYLRGLHFCCEKGCFGGSWEALVFSQVSRGGGSALTLRMSRWGNMLHKLMRTVVHWHVLPVRHSLPPVIVL